MVENSEVEHKRIWDLRFGQEIWFPRIQYAESPRAYRREPISNHSSPSSILTTHPSLNSGCRSCFVEEERGERLLNSVSGFTTFALCDHDLHYFYSSCSSLLAATENLSSSPSRKFICEQLTSLPFLKFVKKEHCSTTNPAKQKIRFEF